MLRTISCGSLMCVVGVALISPDIGRGEGTLHASIRGWDARVTCRRLEVLGRGGILFSRARWWLSVSFPARG